LRTRKIILKKETFPQGEMTELKNPPPAGHYSFAYTPTFAGSTWTTSFAFNTNSSTHTFIIDNITMCPINALRSASYKVSVRKLEYLLLPSDSASQRTPLLLANDKHCDSRSGLAPYSVMSMPDTQKKTIPIRMAL